jgi:RND family efflux transporter MFP subunit
LRIDRGAADRRGVSRLVLWVTAIALVALVVATVVLWSRSAPATARVRVAAVTERRAGGGAVLNASGYVTARRRAAVSVKVTGKLVESIVEEGLPVRAGQVLGRLDDSLQRAAHELAASRLGAARRAVEETRVRLDLAGLTLARTERLVAEAVLGQADLDAAETERRALEARLAREVEEVVVAEREVALRQAEIDDTVIRAPFDGVVISKDAQPGETVSLMSGGGSSTRSSLCTLVDMGSLEIEVDVNEAYIRRVQPGQPVDAVLDAYPDWTIPARVITTIPAADRQKATVEVRIAFEQLDPRILPDMGVKVAFREPAAEIAGGARSIAPAAALRRDGGRDVVFVVRDGRAERRAVTASVAGEEAEILSGVAPGELVVVAGPAELADGQRVELD